MLANHVVYEEDMALFCIKPDCTFYNPTSGDFKGQNGAGMQLDCRYSGYTAYAMDPNVYFFLCNTCSANTYLDLSGFSYSAGSGGITSSVKCQNCASGQTAPPSQTACTTATTTTTTNANSDAAVTPQAAENSDATVTPQAAVTPQGVTQQSSASLVEAPILLILVFVGTLMF